MSKPVYPVPDTVYSLHEILNVLYLKDSPFLNFEHDGRKGVVQDSCSDELMLGMANMAQSQWRYSHTTHEWCPIFYWADSNTVQVTDLFDMEPILNEYGETDSKHWWAVPKGYPVPQFYADPANRYERPVVQQTEEVVPAQHVRAVNFVRQFRPSATVSECVDAYAVYRSYRDEGQTDFVSRRYAGLL